uniref:Uncharacterized protein n=2 Tax=Aegilops tauschii subsp. strangulata TaxID=200361 RepID=A0A453M5H0_AEGTS
GPFPNWMMLEPFVFRRDDKESFPDDIKAYLSVSGTTSWNAPFRIAFVLKEPPLPSRLYAHLPCFPDPRRHIPLAILATHRHLILLRIATDALDEGCCKIFLFTAPTTLPRSNLCLLVPSHTLTIPRKRPVTAYLVIIPSPKTSSAF